MNKVTITARRLIQQLYPFLGKIVFTLQGDNSELVTSFIPEVSIFCNGIAISHLVPNALIEDAITYYHYAIYPQGHVPGVFLSEPVEEGFCMVPEHDCSLDDITSPIPDKKTADSIIAQASGMIAEIKTSMERAEECARRACEASSASFKNKQDVSSLVQEAQGFYNWTKDRQTKLLETLTEFEGYLDAYKNNLQNQIQNLFADNTRELLSSVHEEQLLINNLWSQIEEKFALLDSFGNIEELFESVRQLHEDYVRDINEIRQALAGIHVPTKLSELENDLFQPITNLEIDALYG